ncbi:MAG: sensor histidine kinase [Acetanaerobacterium sp.]
MRKGILFKNKTKIFARILSVAICAIILSVVMCSVAIYFYLEPIIKQSIVNSNREMVIRMSQQVSDSLDEITGYARNISFDDTVQSSLKTNYQTNGIKNTYNYYSMIQTLERKLNEYVILRDNIIYDMFVTDSQNRVLALNQTYGNVLKQPCYEEFLENGQNGFTSINTINYNCSGGQWKTIAYINNIYSKQPAYKNIGKLIVLVNYSELIRPIIFDKKSGIEIELHDDQGITIYSSNTEKNLEEEMDAFGSENHRNYYFKDQIKTDGWYIVYSISSQKISESFSRINTIIIGIVVICLVIMLSVISKIVANIVGPLETLIKSMQQVSEGSRNEHISISTGDEIEEAALVFNKMVKDIDTHTQELIISEKKEHEAQLRMLLYQINPHFIYNTLTCVICLARREDYNNIITLTKKFITLLRANLKVNQELLTTLQNEIEYIDNYVKIIQFSYNNVPDLVWDVDEDLLDMNLPKMILYPLVENSIFHGILPLERKCSLTVHVHREGNCVTACIEDTGCGLSQEGLEDLKRKLTIPDNDGGHIGLSNVNSRLQLIYGRSSCLKIESECQKGTKVSFSFFL